MTKPLLLNTLCWPRSEVVAIPDELWECLSAEEKSSVKKQSSKVGRTLGKIRIKYSNVNVNILNANSILCAVQY